jgi:group II intron reverse transcriptase/maturase
LKRKLDSLYELSQKGKNFNGLFELAFNETTIITAIHNIKSNKGSRTTGIDNKNIDEYLQMDRNGLINLIQKSAKKYKPKPTKRIYIPKSNGKERPLGIPTMIDRIIQECIRIIIEPIIEAKLYQHSYGFRPYRSAKYAIKQIIHFSTIGKAYIAIEGDIKGYFDNINHRLMLSKIWKVGIKDKRIIKMLSLMLKAGYVENDIRQNTETGTPQGGIISPILANLYLNDFDWLVARRYYEPHLTGKSKFIRKERERRARKGSYYVYLVRYADDWIILTRTNQEAKRYLEYLRKYFKYNLKLELSKEKTLITDLRVKPAKFLSANIVVEKPRGKPNSELVTKSYPNPQKVSLQIKTVCKEIKQLKIYRKRNEQLKIIQRINSKLIGYGEYWKAHICAKTFDRIDYYANESLHYVFKYLYKKTWDKHKITIDKLCNNAIRHIGYKYKTYAIEAEKGYWYGVTKISITHTQWLRTPYNQNMIPFTTLGRKLYYNQNKKRSAFDRPNLVGSYNIDNALNHQGNLYNFEYYMNREYAYNRDKGKCKVCGSKNDEKFECHHVKPTLDCSKVNKVINLHWVCKPCHDSIHNKGWNNNLKESQVKKIQRYRELLKENI